MSGKPGTGSNPRDRVEKLIETFDRNITACKSPTYNETQLRVEFVNPFWRELGY